MARVSEVFVPGKLPKVTYNPRDDQELELRITDYEEETGAILTLAGPTKTGKTTLLRKVLTNPILLEGQGIDSVTEMWSRIADHLDLESGRQTSHGTDLSQSTEVGGNVNFWVAEAGGKTTTSDTTSSGEVIFFQNRSAVAMQRALEASGRPLVIDDFHFISQPVQQEIVRTLKPLVLSGVAMIFVSVSHRVYEIVQAELEMEGRVATIEIEFWSEEDLVKIARSGFGALGIVDANDNVAKQLAKQAFGSPHLMQQFCREYCKSNGIRESQDPIFIAKDLEDWPAFFRAQLGTSSELWATRLVRGLKERGSHRTKYSTKLGLDLDGYGLTLLAISKTGPKLSVSKDEVRAKIAELASGATPNLDQTTSFLKKLSRIAAESLSGGQPDDESDIELDNREFQPVLDYVEAGPASEVHIADPFFALYLAWGLQPKLEALAEKARLEQDMDGAPTPAQ